MTYLMVLHTIPEMPIENKTAGSHEMGQNRQERPVKKAGDKKKVETTFCRNGTQALRMTLHIDSFGSHRGSHTALGC